MKRCTAVLLLTVHLQKKTSSKYSFTKRQVEIRIFSFEKVKRCTAVLLITIKSDFKIMAPVDEETQKQTRVLFLTVQSWTATSERNIYKKASMVKA